MRRGSWVVAWFAIGIGVGILGVALGSVGQFALNDVLTGHRMRQAQAELAGRLTESPSRVDDPRMTPSNTSSHRRYRRRNPRAPVIGDPVARLRWRGYEFVVVEGVGSEQLARGPGRYPSTALPGQPGNFAMAGHRVSYGAPFHDLDLLEAGDPVEVTDRVGRFFTYRVVDSTVVDPDETWVIGRDPLGTNRPMLTMTTCHPRLSDRQRLVVWAALDESRNAGAGHGRSVAHFAGREPAARNPFVERGVLSASRVASIRTGGPSYIIRGPRPSHRRAA